MPTDHEATAPTGIDAVRDWLRAAIAEVLGCAVEDGEDYFDAGGDSIQAADLAQRIQRVFGVPFPLRRFFEEPTIDALSRAVSDAVKEDG